EQEAAEKHHRRRERGLQIDRLVEVDQSAGREQLGRRDRNPHCECIGADQAAVALRPPATQAARHAEAGEQPDRTIDQADDEGGKDSDLSGIHRRSLVIASEAKQSSFLGPGDILDCLVASLLAMTVSVVVYGLKMTRSREEPATATNARLASSRGKIVA